MGPDIKLTENMAKDCFTKHKKDPREDQHPSLKVKLPQEKENLRVAPCHQMLISTSLVSPSGHPSSWTKKNIGWPDNASVVVRRAT